MSHYDDNEKFFKEHGGGYFYTEIEGSLWIRAPETLQKQSQISIVKMLRDKGGGRTATIEVEDITMSGKPLMILKFHSLRFPDGNEWDTVNGIRK